MSSEDFSIIPAVQNTIYAIRHSGHTAKSAICDIIDNCTDANASIVRVNLKNDQVSVFDNGTGMNKEELKYLFTLGIHKEHLDGDRGKYGVGFFVSGNVLGKRIRVITKKDNAHYSVDVYVPNLKDWNITINDASLAEINLFNESSKKTVFSPIPDTGTVVIVDNCFQKMSPSFVTDFRKTLGETFRYLIDDGLNIYLNNKIVSPIDLLVVCDKDTEFICEYGYNGKPRLEMPVFINSNDEEVRGSIKLRIINNPNNPVERHGVCVIRNKRQLTSRVRWYNFCGDYNYCNHAIIEIDFNDDLDEVFNVDMKKTDVQFTGEVLKVLQKVIGPEMTKLANREKQRSLDSNYKESMDILRNLQNMLSSPNINIGPQDFVPAQVHTKTELTTKVITPIIRTPRTPTGKHRNTGKKSNPSGGRPAFEFEIAKMGQDGLHYVYQKDNRIYKIILNSEHAHITSLLEKKNKQSLETFGITIWSQVLSECTITDIETKNKLNELRCAESDYLRRYAKSRLEL